MRNQRAGRRERAVSTAPPAEGLAALRCCKASRALRWAVGVAVAVIAAIGIVLMFLLTQATNNRELYERNYGRLFVLNMVVAGVLLLVILWVVVRLVSRLRRGKFGSRLLVKLAAIFALVGLLPGRADLRGVLPVRLALDRELVRREGGRRARRRPEPGPRHARHPGQRPRPTRRARPPAQLAETPDTSAPLALERLREQLSANDVVLWSGTGQLIASTGQSRFQLHPERPTPQQLRNRAQPARR